MFPRTSVGCTLVACKLAASFEHRSPAPIWWLGPVAPLQSWDRKEHVSYESSKNMDKSVGSKFTLLLVMPC